MTRRRSGLSRRDFLASLIPGRRGNAAGALTAWVSTPDDPGADQSAAAPPDTAPIGQPDPQRLAVIAGRFCLAYQGTLCSTCRERCPVEGAILIERGLPRVDPTHCNGCRVCHDVCPAPTNAIRIVPRPTPAPSSPC
ncbi:MAG: hypothetical protein D6781_10965 [Verrucomicrobia bacterium]|nr:MAG: hypothetical protein D6781_10965 [Verrucomicrobiota bacterium]